MLPIEDGATLPLLYHLNSEPWLNVEAYNDATCHVEYKEMPGLGSPIALPQVGDSETLRLLKARQSCRSYRQKAMPASALAALLRGAYGLLGLRNDPAGFLMYGRPVPSAGGLYPLELYAATRSVEGVADGFYHYGISRHQLEPLATGSMLSTLTGTMLGQPYVGDGNVIFFLTAIFDRTLRRYGPRGYRYILFEAGHTAQNLCLLAAEHGLGTLCIGGFEDGKLNDAMGLDGTREAVLYCVCAGYPMETAS